MEKTVRESSQKKGVIGVTLAPHETAPALDSLSGPNTQYPTKGIGVRTMPFRREGMCYPAQKKTTCHALEAEGVNLTFSV